MEKIEKKKASFLFFWNLRDSPQSCRTEIKRTVPQILKESGAIMMKKRIIGILAGMICGFFGTGGGMLLVPSFVYMLKIEPKKARATSLCCMLAMVITSSIFYYKNNYINWQSGLLCAVGGIVGGYFGAKLLKKVPDYILKIVFICFLIYASYNMIF